MKKIEAFLIVCVFVCLVSLASLALFSNSNKPIDSTTMTWSVPIQKETSQKKTTMTWKEPFQNETKILVEKKSLTAFPTQKEISDFKKAVD